MKDKTKHISMNSESENYSDSFLFKKEFYLDKITVFLMESFLYKSGGHEIQ